MDDLRQSEETERDRHEAYAVGQFRQPEREPLLAGVDVGPHQTEEQADENHGHRLADAALRQHDGGDEAEHHEGEVFGRPEALRDLGQRLRKQRDQHGGESSRR